MDEGTLALLDGPAAKRCAQETAAGAEKEGGASTLPSLYPWSIRTMKGFTAVRREADGTNRRIDGLRDTIGDKVRNHERRLDALEATAPKDPRRS